MVGNSSITRFLYGSPPLVAINSSMAACQSIAPPIPAGSELVDGEPLRGGKLEISAEPWKILTFRLE